MFPNNLRRERELQGITQVALAAKSNMAAPLISVVENGKMIPSPIFVKRVCKALGKTQMELFPEYQLMKR